MHAIHVSDDGALRWAPAPEPAPGTGEALVEVHATAVNRADLAQRAGRYPPPPGASEILGLECAGVVLEAPGDADVAPGDRVYALLGGGGYAERVAVPAAMLMPIPTGWSFETAAAVPEVFITAYLNLFHEAGLRAGERVMIHGGASGVGTAAIQLAVAAGCRVYATAGREDKVAACERLGASCTVDYRREDVRSVVREDLRAHGGPDAGIDVVLDMVGESYVDTNMALLGRGGRIVYISALSGREACFDISMLMRKHATVRGSTLRSRPLEEKVALVEGFQSRFGDALAAGAIAPVIDRVVDVRDAEAAHEALRRNDTIGKVVLRVRA